jgi:hypothetical protein
MGINAEQYYFFYKYYEFWIFHALIYYQVLEEVKLNNIHL